MLGESVAGIAVVVVSLTDLCYATSLTSVGE